MLRERGPGLAQLALANPQFERSPEGPPYCPKVKRSTVEKSLAAPSLT